MMASVAEKIIRGHLVEGEPAEGEEIAIKIDQTLTQDATGTMAYLQFEALGVPRVRTRLSVSYIDHNTLQASPESADDHLYLQTVAQRYGVYFSKAGNGICHQVHLERFARPGETLLGSDSHTPTAGGLGMLAVGAGGLDVAVAMAGAPFYLKMPRVTGVRLRGRLPDWVSAKDVALEVLRRIGVRGGVGRILEYFGPGVKSLTVPERATIANMGTETGATASVFPSDEETRRFLVSEGRPRDWRRLLPGGEEYQERLEIDLAELEPLIALPHSPGNVTTVKSVEGTPVQQVAIGSCTNSSYKDLMTVAAMLKGRRVNPDVSLVITPGSRQVLAALAKNGALADLLASGARILEAACGPCIGMGQAPPSGGASLRTFNRNFQGRSGTASAGVYLCSPEVAAASALKGEVTDPRRLHVPYRRVRLPSRFKLDDSLIIRPPKSPRSVKVIRGPNIKPLPPLGPLPDTVEGEVLLKLGDNITTDDIIPAGAHTLPLRSNVPAISSYVFERIDPTFVARIKEKGGGVLVGGENYGQGSSREHAAMAPRFLGLKAVVAKSFSRIHAANLVNFGIPPLTFRDPGDYDRISQGDIISIPKLKTILEEGGALEMKNLVTGEKIHLSHSLSKRERTILASGGLLNYYKTKMAA
ncbi:MAG: aconitate hydratase [Candidatus Bathyarchaeia archaeon]